MKLRRLIIPCFVVLTLLFVTSRGPVSAQADKSLDMAGNYTVSGANSDGSKPYTGKVTIDGSGPIYGLSFSSTDTTPASTPAIALGNVLVDAQGDDACTEVVYSRYSDGTMVGAWIDFTSGNTLSLETLIPTAKTTDFAGSYRIVGAYGTGKAYEGKVEITPSKDGPYVLNYDYPADSVNAALKTQGYGFAAGESFGVVLSVNAKVSIDKCSFWVLQFQKDGNYTAEFYQDGKTGTEKGTRTN